MGSGRQRLVNRSSLPLRVELQITTIRRRRCSPAAHSGPAESRNSVRPHLGTPESHPIFGGIRTTQHPLRRGLAIPAYLSHSKSREYLDQPGVAGYITIAGSFDRNASMRL